MASLILSTIDGRALDKITLDGSTLKYLGGAAKPMFDAVLDSGKTPAQAFDMLTDWSNGYLVIERAEVGR